MSKFNYILDPGHGGVHPMTGEYVTKGKRSPKFDNGLTLYEGVNNRDNVILIQEALQNEGIDCSVLVDTWQDTPLNIRCAKANQINKDKKSVLISIHSDGFGSGDWNPANGVTVFHAPNASPKSKVFAGLLGAQFKTNFETYSRFRGVKSGDFAIIRDTDCPAVLLELGFHTNKREANLMITEDFKQRAVQCIVNAIKAFEQV